MDIHPFLIVRTIINDHGMVEEFYICIYVVTLNCHWFQHVARHVIVITCAK